ncbi:hypothetical protein ESZ53_01690 [Salinibacterium sp. UTAS2018]|uniref:hypothetical protein n=1 Tax=Salinibacterium sp. UTAS2018 TaxID=2508880 RepID=UPI0010094238|nr:hypothetical protein [Salinibacterium sp. UTAS2018]QAV69263.1 hypothetical protein ESZ53_01690 [Salinibacterium sp. UTAS2018]
MCTQASARSTDTPRPAPLAAEPLCEGDSDVIAQPFPPLSASEHAALHSTEDPIAEWIEELAPSTGL